MPFTPFDAANHAIGRARALLGPSRRRSDFIADSVRADMRRLSVVIAVSALDTYLHRLVVERAFSHEKLPKPLARLGVPFERLLEQADATKAAARSKPHRARPRVAIKRELRDRLLRETFQRFEDVGTALSMAGRPRDWAAIGQKFDVPRTPDELRAALNAIVTRRNQIVHEGDYRRLERPRDSARNPMTHREASDSIDFVESLIAAIHNTA